MINKIFRLDSPQKFNEALVLQRIKKTWLAPSLWAKAAALVALMSIRKSLILSDRLKEVLLFFLTFLLPFGILSLAYLKAGIHPLGSKTILICDMSGQYVDFFSTYYEILKEGKSILYSWQAGLGLNFLGLFAYYLSSPFSLLIMLFDRQHLTEALQLITLLKVGACGLTFAVYIRNALKVSKPHLLLIFSVLYALMSYTIVYTFNLMWLEGVVLLPLVLLGAELLLQENKTLLFILSLIALFLSNFYVAYMAGIFSLLYFAAAAFSRYSSQEMRILLHRFLLFGLSALLAAGCTAFLLLPTFFALRNGQGGPDLSLFNWKINFKLFDLLSKAQLGAYDTLKYKGLPNIYCGLLPLLLLPLYFLNQRIPVKERIIYAILLGFLVISFNFSNLDLVWHAFDQPDWFPNRYSFVFSFLLLFLAVKSLQSLKAEDIPRLIKAGTCWLLIIVALQKINYTYLSDRLLMISLFLIGLYILLLAGVLKYESRRNLLLLILTASILMESTLNSWYLIKRLDGEFTYVSKQEYNKTLSQLRQIIPEIQAKDNSFYRLDRIGGRTYNDPMNLNYNGITHFSSMSSQPMMKTLRQLGFLTTAGYKSVNFGGSTPLTESLLGIKYVVSAKEKGLGYREILDKGEFKAYENKSVLPVGFLVHRAILDFDPAKDDNPFRLQNTLINQMLGHTENTVQRAYFLPLSIDQVNLDNVFIAYEKGKEVCRRITNNQEGTIEYVLTNPREQQVYACFQTIDNTVRIFINEEEIKGYLPVYNKRIIDLGYFQANQTLKVKLLFKNEGFAIAEKYFYGLDQQGLVEALSPLQRDLLEDIEVSDTSVRGKVLVKDRTFLFTSIPFDPGWTAWVDGEKVPIRKIANAFIGLELTEGEHRVAFHFRPYGLKPGLIISGISLILLLVVFMRNRKWKFKNIKQ